MTKKAPLLLGMSGGAARNRLVKSILFMLAQKVGLDTCFRCGTKIETVAEFSMDHKEDWERSADPVKAFFDLANIAFSHLSCNSGAASRPTKKYTSKLERNKAGNARYRQTEKGRDAVDRRREKRRSSRIGEGASI